MADPSGPTAAVIGVTSTAAAMTLFGSLIGVEPQALVWSSCGTILGYGLAPKVGLLRTLFVCVAVVLASALLGTWAAHEYSSGGQFARNGWSLAIAVVFHPVLAAILESAPTIGRALVDKVLRLFGVQR